MGKKSANRDSRKQPPTPEMIFTKLQRIAPSLIPSRRQQIRIECITAVSLIVSLFLLSVILIPTPYSSMYGFFALLSVCAGIPIILAWRLLASENQILRLIGLDHRQKAQMIANILNQPHLCHIFPNKANLFSIRTVGGKNLAQGPVCTMSPQELAQIHSLIRSKCIHLQEKPNSATQGLTLVELLGIVAIISILLTIALPSIMGIMEATNEAALKRRIQTLNFAVEQARLRKYDPVLDSTDKYAVYQYLLDNNFLIKGQGTNEPVNP